MVVTQEKKQLSLVGKIRGKSLHAERIVGDTRIWYWMPKDSEYVVIEYLGKNTLVKLRPDTTVTRKELKDMGIRITNE